MGRAAALDTERAAGRVRGPLHGIPFLVRDNIATKDRMKTIAGSWARLESVVPRDAHIVARPREAGALLLGHATLSEWADMRSSNHAEGYSARGDQARSPYNLTKILEEIFQEVRLLLRRIFICSHYELEPMVVVRKYNK